MIDRIKQFIKDENENKELRRKLDSMTQPLRNRPRLLNSIKAFQNEASRITRAINRIGKDFGQHSRPDSRPELKSRVSRAVDNAGSAAQMAGNQIPTSLEQASRFFDIERRERHNLTWTRFACGARPLTRSNSYGTNYDEEGADQVCSGLFG